MLIIGLPFTKGHLASEDFALLFAFGFWSAVGLANIMPKSRANAPSTREDGIWVSDQVILSA